MNLPDTIDAHVRALPVNLQRETLDFIAYLAQRYGLPSTPPDRMSTEAFIARFSGSLGADFPDDIDDTDLAPDA
jgi:hypothetical protein